MTVIRSSKSTIYTMDGTIVQEARPSVDRLGCLAFTKIKEEMLERHHKPSNAKYDGILQVGTK